MEEVPTVEQQEVHVTAEEEPFDIVNEMTIDRKRIKLAPVNCQINQLPTVDEVYEKDLPICCNADEILITHYIISLNFDFERKVVGGVLVIFPVRRTDSVVKIMLDACSLQIKRVSSSNLSLKDLPRTNLKELYSSVTNDHSPVQNLEFTVDKWSLSINLASLTFPTAIKIEYETLPSSPSMQWRPCKGFVATSPLCCFTPAAPVNNRGLFPCQEAPSSMGTWECFVIAEKEYSAYLSSDKPAVIVETNDQSTISYFNCSETLPLSTFAFIVSQISPANIFEIKPPNHQLPQIKNDASRYHLDKCYCGADKQTSTGQMLCSQCDELSFIPVRIIFQNDPNFDVNKLSSFIIGLLRVCFSVLGPLPFKRMDILLMPDCFPTIGLCNPNMIFLSNCVLTGQTPLIYSRLSHEIGHFWFGLSIGAADWTEEWLSEGFATFTEDIFHRMLLEEMKITATTPEKIEEVEEALEELRLKPCVRLLTLQNELENTNKEQQGLQLLQQPNHHRDNETPKHIVNGLEPMKQFMQIHYLKGYFFLKHLSGIVGGEAVFLKFLHSYVSKFQGQLITSQDFLTFFKEQFCTITTNSSTSSSTVISYSVVDSVASEFLQNASLPELYGNANVRQPTFMLAYQVQNLFQDSIEQLTKINNLTLWFNCHTTDDLLFLDGSLDDLYLNATEKVLFLEQVLESTLYLSKHRLEYIFKFLERLIQPSFSNPEIQHRWCEIIIKFQHLPEIKTLKHFLLQFPAMGIYLYGEMIISERRAFQKLARKLYEARKDVMDPPCVHVLKQMIF